jgi:hypothetical protein
MIGFPYGTTAPFNIFQGWQGFPNGKKNKKQNRDPLARWQVTETPINPKLTKPHRMP